MGVGEFIRREFWGSRLLFNFFFHGGHVGLFALGW